MATVANEHACAPGAALAEASIWRWRLAREGGVPKAGPPHVMAGVMPVLAKIVALLFIFVMYLARAVRPLAAARRLLACVAMRLLPELTGAKVGNGGVRFDRRSLCCDALGGLAGQGAVPGPDDRFRCAVCEVFPL